jgi:hypothetical protein
VPTIPYRVLCPPWQSLSNIKPSMTEFFNASRYQSIFFNFPAKTLGPALLSPINALCNIRADFGRGTANMRGGP